MRPWFATLLHLNKINLSAAVARVEKERSRDMILYSPANAFEQSSVKDWKVTSVRRQQVMQNNRDSQFDREVFNGL